MKGVFVSSDFIEDEVGNLRLLEINTDTQVLSQNHKYFNFSEFINLLSNNNISKITVINKPNLHYEFVNFLSASIAVSASFVNEFIKIDEPPNNIYPTHVIDSTDKFILRLSYDEAAIIDSEYAKGTLNLLKLFADYNETSSVVSFYHSSSANGLYNTINYENNFNSNNIPDVILKNIYEDHKISSFYKIGSEIDGESNENRWNQFIANVSEENKLIQKFHFNENSISDNKINSIRNYSILYGIDLNVLNLANYKSFTVFDLPSSSIYDPTQYVNLIDTKHYYEFATNVVKNEGIFDGILDRHRVIKSDGEEIELSQIQIGDEIKSYYIGNTSQNEGSFDYLNWQISGSTFPSESYLTSSIVIYKNSKSLSNKTLINIEVNNNEDSLFVAPIKSFLVYDNLEGLIKWKTAININSGSDFLIDYDGSTAQVTNNQLYITNENDLGLVEIDVEDTDTYIIAGTTPINSFVTHNAPCFVEGTKIKLSNGDYKNIEHVNPDDEVYTFDIKNDKLTTNKVKAIFSKKVKSTVKYVFENGEELQCTLDHPLYVEGKGWSSYSNDISNAKYSLEQTVQKININDSVKLLNGNTKIIQIELIDKPVVVYNLQDIENNNNFFANNILVHNRFCFIEGTEITLQHGEKKYIENIKEGDIVLSFNEKTNQQEFNKVLKIYKPKHDDLVEYTISNGKKIISTVDHPYYVNGIQIASYNPELTSARYEILKNVLPIKVGDELNLDNGGIAKIESITELEKKLTQTYIFTVENNNNFYANGVLVHNKCFLAGTKILTDVGEINIENIKDTTNIISFNTQTGKNETDTVSTLSKHNVTEILKIVLEENIEIFTTTEHPFYTKQNNWVKAKDLIIGDECKKVNNTFCKVIHKELIQGEYEVYNLRNVLKNNNFYANNILVHNKL